MICSTLMISRWKTWSPGRSTQKTSRIAPYCTKKRGSWGLPNSTGVFRCSVAFDVVCYIVPHLAIKMDRFSATGRKKRRVYSLHPVRNRKKRETHMRNDLGLFQSCMTMPCWPCSLCWPNKYSLIDQTPQWKP